MVDESLSGETVAELRQESRATRARLEAAQAEAAALRALLATRTHQHDLAWQDVQRLTSELATERARAADPAADLSDELALARERFAAVETVLGAVAASLGWRGLDRRRFRALVAEAGRTVPETGPQAVRHAVLFDAAKRVLGLRV